MLAFVLPLLLGGGAASADVRAARAVRAAAQFVAQPAQTSRGYESEEESKRETREDERGQYRGTSRHTGSHEKTRHAQGHLTELPDAATASGNPSAGHTTRAVSRPTQLPVLHCVFRC
ncbi:hypothetical protein [Streptomyces sp. NBRC 110611]|uniref:hypothetical protein n=1 Tax=Streptomyces sp. NBRC 110611 TaxID=1621259 RepID=UPI0011BD544D|nr:hypothetical protein [Streptomyces sp. NBRC 110611]